MAKATLIWVSKNGAASRVISLPRWVVLGLAGGFCALLLASVAGIWWGTELYARVQDRSAEIYDLEQALASGRQLLGEREDQVLRAQQENAAMEVELKRIQGVDEKVRRLLGLNQQTYDTEVSHQGGMGISDRREGMLGAGDTAVADVAPINMASLEYTRTLQSSLREVLDHLEDKNEASLSYPMILPVTSDKAWLSCSFGRRSSPFSPERKEFHNGLDIAGPWKDPILATADGKVIRVGKDRLLGNYVKIQHTSKIKTLYGHMATTAVESGARVKRGDVIGYMGNSGRSTGTHLHYSVSVDGKFVNPLDYIWDRPFHQLKL